MRARRWLWLILPMGLLAAAAGAVSVTPRWRAELRWALSSMITPAEKAGVRLQR